MKIVSRNIDSIRPAEYNPRKISHKDLERLKESLKKFNQVDPVLINKRPGRDGIIIGGHQRVKAMRALGYKTVQCVELDLSEREERELNVRLNKNTGEWDFSVLSEFFSAKDLCDWGFDDKALTKALSEINVFDVEEEEEPEEVRGRASILFDLTEKSEVIKALRELEEKMPGVKVYA